MDTTENMELGTSLEILWMQIIINIITFIFIIFTIFT